MPPQFLYFDLGKVLVDFSTERMFRQLAAVSGVDPAHVREVIVDDGLQRQYETGRLSSREFYEAFCQRTATRPDYEALARAGSEIFTLSVPMLPVVGQLHNAGYRLGILSNTCESHWQYCLRRFHVLGELFAVHALSYQIGACKPDAAIFLAASKLAGCRPRDIFFTDDIAEHVAGAKSAGLDAVQYTTTPQLVADLRQRGIHFNY